MFNEAFQLYKELPSHSLAPNKITFANLLKGIRNMKEPDVEKALEFLNLYNS